MRNRRIATGLVLASLLLWGFAGATESGSKSAPRLVHDFFPGEFDPDLSLERLTQVDDTLFFIARDLESGPRLWRTENGGSGIQRVQVQGRAEQAGDDHDIVGRMGQFLLWTVRPMEDPDAEVLLSSTVQGDGIPLHSYRPRDVDSVAIAGNRFFFQDCTDSGCDVWSTDGTVAGTRALSTVNARFSGEPLQISGTFADRWLLLRVRQDLFAYDFVADRVQLLLPDYAQRADLFPTGNTLFVRVTPVEAPQRGRLFASRLETPRAVQIFESLSINVAGKREGRLYFSNGGGRLWSSDGRPEGTRSYSGIRRDLYDFSEIVDQLGAIGSTTLIPMPGYYFGGLLGIDEAKGEARMLKLFCDHKYTCPASMSPVTLVGGQAFEAVNGRLWESDGTREGTRLAEIFSKVNADSFRGLNGRLLLGGTSRDGVEQLWETDGTAEGTRVLSDGTRDRPFRVQSPPVPLSDGLLVVAERKPVGKQLWRVADGSATPLTSLRHQGTGIYPYTAVPLGNRVVIKGANANWWAAGEDGSVETLPLYDDDCAVPESCAAERVVVGQRLLLVTTRQELWSSDGTAAGSGAVPLTGEDGNVAEVAALGRLGGQGLAMDYLGGLWTSDGTPSGTRLFARLPVDSSLAYEPVGPPVPVGSRSFLFRRVASEDDPEASASLEIWRTNGTQAGTVLLATTPFPFDFISYLSPAVVAGRLFFRFGGTLWVSDGSAAGTHPLENQLPGGTFSLIAGTDTLYAGAGYLDEDLEHQALWAVNPQTLEASLVGTFSYVGGGAVGTTLGSVFGDTLIFQATQELGIKQRWWVTEGTAVSTHLVPGLLPRNQVREFFNVAGRRYFRSCEAEHGCELWSTDRLGEDLRLVADVWPGQGSGDPEILAVDGGTIWFAATAPSVGRELWKIDVSAVP